MYSTTGISDSSPRTGVENAFNFRDLYRRIRLFLRREGSVPLVAFRRSGDIYATDDAIRELFPENTHLMMADMARDRVLFWIARADLLAGIRGADESRFGLQ